MDLEASAIKCLEELEEIVCGVDCSTHVRQRIKHLCAELRICYFLLSQKSSDAFDEDV